MNLPEFNNDQKNWIVENLVERVQYREIARKFLERFSDFELPDEMPKSEYEDLFGKRCWHYLREDRPLGQEIAKRREEYDAENLGHLALTSKRYRIELLEKFYDRVIELEGKIERKELDIDQAKVLITLALHRLRPLNEYTKLTGGGGPAPVKESGEPKTSGFLENLYGGGIPTEVEADDDG